MNIGLVDVDGHNFPNLALMKLSAFHKSKGDNVEFAINLKHYDIIYMSKIFTFTKDPAYNFLADKIIKGGTGYDLDIHLPDDVENITPDYDLYGLESAYGFLTRGCIRKCNFCIVPKKEGYIKANADITDFIGPMKSAILLDNNVLAHEHGIRQIEKIADLGIKIDFNQGLDARLIDKEIAKLLSKVKWLNPLRLACDSMNQIEPVKKAVELLRWYNVTPYRYFVYTLIQDLEEAIERIRILKGLALSPFAQAYRDFENNIEPDKETKDFCRWVNRKQIFYKIPFEEYE